MSAPSYSVLVNVQTRFLPEQSDVAASRFAFAYTIEITNHSELSVQLLSRYWIITDGNGTEQHVQGPGVIGQKPHIASGASFSYSSGCVLNTPVGVMQGHYQMRTAEGERFECPIAPFRLAQPGALH